MTTTTRTTKAGPIQRSITITHALCGRCEVRVTEVQRGKRTEDTYLLEQLPSQIGGVVFTVRKFADGGDSYQVLLNAPGGGHSCDCKWDCYGSHKKNCRHVDLCLQALREKKF
jgi:hypothetical protein